MNKIIISKPTDRERVEPNSTISFEFTVDYLDYADNSIPVVLKIADDAAFTTNVISFTPTSLSINRTGTFETVSGNEFLSSDIDKVIKFNYAYPNEKKVVYAKLVITEAGNDFESTPIILISLDNLTFKTKPIQMSEKPTCVKILDKKNISNINNFYIIVSVCNNALDATPTWENIGSAYNNNFFTFNNNTKTAANWAIGVMYSFVKLAPLEYVDIREIMIAYI